MVLAQYCVTGRSDPVQTRTRALRKVVYRQACRRREENDRPASDDWAVLLQTGDVPRAQPTLRQPGHPRSSSLSLAGLGGSGLKWKYEWQCNATLEQMDGLVYGHLSKGVCSILHSNKFTRVLLQTKRS